MADLNAALLAFAGVLVGGYFNNFLAEDYRRFRDSQALAGALAGELLSHDDRSTDLRAGLVNLLAFAEKGTPVALPEMPVPTSPVFEENAGKIGLLEPDLARDVAFVYEHIRALRSAFYLLSRPYKGLSDQENAAMVAATIRGAIRRIDSAKEIGTPLVERLKEHARASYAQRPLTKRLRNYGIVALLILAALILTRSSDSGYRADCTTTISNGVQHMICK
jgi:hypothetical protein